MKYGGDVSENWNNIPSVADVHLSRNFWKALKPLTECLDSNLDRPGIVCHLDFQFLITSNKNLPNPADLGIIFILLPLLSFHFCGKGTLPGTGFNGYLFSSVICHCETRQLLFLAHPQLSAGFWMHLNFMHCGFYFLWLQQDVHIKSFVQNWYPYPKFRCLQWTLSKQ